MFCCMESTVYLRLITVWQRVGVSGQQGGGGWSGWDVPVCALAAVCSLNKIQHNDSQCAEDLSLITPSNEAHEEKKWSLPPAPARNIAFARPPYRPSCPE